MVTVVLLHRLLFQPPTVTQLTSVPASSFFKMPAPCTCIQSSRLVAGTASEAHCYRGISTKLRLDLQGLYGVLLPGVALWFPRFVLVCDRIPCKSICTHLKGNALRVDRPHRIDSQQLSAVHEKLSLIIATGNVPSYPGSNVQRHALFPGTSKANSPAMGEQIVSPPLPRPSTYMGLLIPCRDSGVNRAVNEPSCSQRVFVAGSKIAFGQTLVFHARCHIHFVASIVNFKIYFYLGLLVDIHSILPALSHR